MSATLPLSVLSLYPPLRQRLRAITLLQRSMGEGGKECGDAALARTLEQHIFHGTLMQQADYNAKVLQVAWNLKTNAPYLLGTYTPDVLTFLDDQALAHGTAAAEWWEHHEQRLKRQQQLLHEEAKFEEAEQSVSAHGGLVCNRCHSRSIAVQQQQTRSADEGMTVYCTCKQCGLRWKM
jgi:DNA-directed RNA polymerase subunit M/transcription elongation factor TFIIS